MCPVSNFRNLYEQFLVDMGWLVGLRAPVGTTLRSALRGEALETRSGARSSGVSLLSSG
jgi:hypothetical protein